MSVGTHSAVGVHRNAHAACHGLSFSLVLFDELRGCWRTEVGVRIAQTARLVVVGVPIAKQRVALTAVALSLLDRTWHLVIISTHFSVLNY